MYLRYKVGDPLTMFECDQCQARVCLKASVPVTDVVGGIYTNDEFALRSLPYQTSFRCPECNALHFFQDFAFVQ